MPEPTGVLLMHYGTPSGPDDVERYYTDIRGGRPPSPEALDELRGRYDAIGGDFPLARITREQADALERELASDDGASFRVYLGAKHSPPFVADAVLAMAGDGIRRAVGLVLAPHYSRMSVGGYIDRAREAAPEGLEIDFVESWFGREDLLDLLAERVRAALEEIPFDVRRDALVVFTAHSLPERILEWDDPYPRQLAETAQLVGSRALTSNVRTAWQSAGRTGEPWLGPDLVEVIEEAGKQEIPAIVVCPCGFTADHLEILYDVDIEAREAAERAGVQLVRTRSMNADPEFIGVLAGIVRERVAARQEA